jgi:CRP/FNR family transcriptional regulator
MPAIEMKHKNDPPSPCDVFLKEQPSDCLGCAVRSSALFAQLDKSELDHRLEPIYNCLVEADNIVYRAGASAEAVFTIRWGVVNL